jgi:histidine triad (HIT) family protein
MHNHAPADYRCPICLGIARIENEHTLIRQSDIVFRDDLVMVFITSFFIGKNPGHLVVVPCEHYENLYDLPDVVGSHIFVIARKMAVAMKKAYGCEGITTLQNNEPAGNQHAFHYHLHLFPRHTDDHLHEHMMVKRNTTAEERLPYASAILDVLLNQA